MHIEQGKTVLRVCSLSRQWHSIYQTGVYHDCIFWHICFCHTIKYIWPVVFITETSSVSTCPVRPDRKLRCWDASDWVRKRWIQNWYYMYLINFMSHIPIHYMRVSNLANQKSQKLGVVGRKLKDSRHFPYHLYFTNNVIETIISK